MNLRFRDATFIKLILLTLLLSVAYLNLYGQFATQEPKSRQFVYTLTGEAWLRVYRANDAGDPDSWHPWYTTIWTSYKPVVKQHGKDFEITFRTPDLPEPMP